MWPWEHLAFGYLLYSAYARLRFAHPPSAGAAVVLAAATQLPDLIDKPLAWTFGVLPSGLSLGHSLLFAIPLLVVGVGVARRAGRPWYGGALAVGYLSHLLGDVLYNAMWGPPAVGFLLWPIFPTPEHSGVGFFTRFFELLSRYVAVLDTPLGHRYLAAEAVLLLGALVLWVLDGRPGLPGRDRS